MDGVAASGPVSFTDNNGKQYLVPASELFFDVDGTVQSKGEEPYEALQIDNAFKAWTAYLATSGVLTRSEAATPVPAMVITSKTAGTFGNATTVEIAGVAAANGAFTATVTEIEPHEGLKVDTIDDLHSELLTYDAAGSPSPAQLPAAGTYTADATTGEIEVPAADASAAFLLKAKAPVTAGTTTDVEITAPADGKFTMTVTRTKKKPGATSATLGTDFDYTLTVAPPAGSTTPGVPGEGKFQLAGGAPQQAATPAKVTLMTGV